MIRRSFGGEYMACYIVTAYCENCSIAHPTGIELEWPERISSKRSIAEIFSDIELPSEIVMMSRNYFQCPQTGKMYKQTDNNRLFLTQKPE
jgi:hypothetical protein